jgi:hypothetical protein
MSRLLRPHRQLGEPRCDDALPTSRCARYSSSAGIDVHCLSEVVATEGELQDRRLHVTECGCVIGRCGGQRGPLPSLVVGVLDERSVIVVKIAGGLQCPDGIRLSGQNECHLLGECDCGRCIDGTDECSLLLIGLCAHGAEFGTVRGRIDRRRWLGRACCCGASERNNCEAKYEAWAGAANR